MFIKTKLNHLVQSHRKIITNKASYDINLQIYKGEISKIIKFDDIKKIRFKTLPLTSNVLSIFSWIRIKQEKLRLSLAVQEPSPQYNQEEENLNEHP